MLFGIGKFEFIFTVIIAGSIMLSVYVSVKKEKAKMSVETHRGIDGFSVDVETPEDVYNTLDGMHTQAMMELGEDHEVTTWLAHKLDEMLEKIELDEDKLMAP
jgi:hypothetical protein